MAKDVVLRPQAGPQEKFLASPADIAIYGGSAGGGKTYALLLECLRNVGNGGFGAVIFRRNTTQIMNEGGLWDTASNLYLRLGAKAYRSPKPAFRWPSGAKITFSHLQNDAEVRGFQGSQICLIGFDELTHFSERQFFYLLSRNRSMCGVKPYVRCTCNPDSDSWVADFISWWIDQNTGYPIPERSGVLRYMYRVEGKIHWGDSKEELAKELGVSPDLCKSVTFISSSIFDNKILLSVDPSYLASLNALPIVEKERLLKGNWKIRPCAGLYFPMDKAEIVDELPSPIVAIARAWDLAATEISNTDRSPDRTVGALCARLKDGRFIFLDVVRRAYNAAQVRKLIQNTAKHDLLRYKCNRIYIPQDPGQAGKEQAASYVRMLAGYNIHVRAVSGNKVVRAEPLSAQWQANNVLILRGGWNDEFLTEMEGFPDSLHDDQVDAAGDAFKAVSNAVDWSEFLM